MPILHAISERLGYVPPAAVARIASALNITQAEVHGVITFYHDFRTTPPGDHVLKLCRAEACQAMGCDLLVKGAYTQSRLRQLIFGGATRHILAHAALPVLMAH